MASSISDTTASPAPFSPFSTHSASSDLATSDESPDLGAFTTVFRALNELQPRTFPVPLSAAHAPGTVTGTGTGTPPTASSNLSTAEYDSDTNRGSTVWTHQPIASYLALSSRGVPSSQSRASSPPPSSPPSSDTEGDLVLDGDGNATHNHDLPTDPDLDLDLDLDLAQPSLGYLDEALGFLAAERAKLAAQQSAWRGHASSTSDSAWRHPAQHTQRRKRRRKKAKSAVREAGEGSRTETAGVDADGDADADADDASSSAAELEPDSSSPAYFKSTPATPRDRLDPASKPNPHANLNLSLSKKLAHSRSTPSLRGTAVQLDPRVVRLRALAMRLRILFPEDAAALTAVLSSASFQASAPDFIDPRGPPPQPGEPLTHVFIDYSNILIGFLTHLRRHPHLSTSKTKHLSHAALALILERGRPTTRRVLAASSPLYQPIDSAEQLGYEVRVYARVPDTGTGADRQRHHTHSHSHSQSNSHSQSHSHSMSVDWKARHRRGRSGGAATTASATPAAATPTSTESEGAGAGAAPGRVRYREQGVDELLQLKLHQAIADVDAPPAGSTIVLATGDGNVGQFNEEGFLGCVRTALKKGWRVELYAWEGGLSKAWGREFGGASGGGGGGNSSGSGSGSGSGASVVNGSGAAGVGGSGGGPWAGKFRIVYMDHFGADLLEA
ncbi:hypothetical protein DENSPDRAFT_930466 [Dentipellis sp. KUC8613]|nr:hypothetical protein DENSPDRAFT_930466 [Dentipellis sp. KUC8613]